jgi:hypothetical protein
MGDAKKAMSMTSGQRSSKSPSARAMAAGPAKSKTFLTGDPFLAY